mmetsp:Transcript_20286/g.45138  ORF Transcript_20286/g.45138 Transcript_20286/m.45138 type:complete len:211 (-) Transcript_20286:304-936(-)
MYDAEGGGGLCTVCTAVVAFSTAAVVIFSTVTVTVLLLLLTTRFFFCFGAGEGTDVGHYALVEGSVHTVGLEEGRYEQGVSIAQDHLTDYSFIVFSFLLSFFLFPFLVIVLLVVTAVTAAAAAVPVGIERTNITNNRLPNLSEVGHPRRGIQNILRRCATATISLIVIVPLDHHGQGYHSLHALVPIDISICTGTAAAASATAISRRHLH